MKPQSHPSPRLPVVYSMYHPRCSSCCRFISLPDAGFSLSGVTNHPLKEILRVIPVTTRNLRWVKRNINNQQVASPLIPHRYQSQMLGEQEDDDSTKMPLLAANPEQAGPCFAVWKQLGQRQAPHGKSSAMSFSSSSFTITITVTLCPNFYNQAFGCTKTHVIQKELCNITMQNRFG